MIGGSYSLELRAPLSRYSFIGRVAFLCEAPNFDPAKSQTPDMNATKLGMRYYVLGLLVTIPYKWGNFNPE